MPATGSVVIPAHDEANVIGRCLAALAAQDEARELDIVVVANGCADDTADRARSFADRLPNLHVIELDEGNKVLALNAGDQVVSSYPRIYLDADIELREGSVGDLLVALAQPAPRVAGPTVEFDARDSTQLVNRFYSVYVRIPYVRQGLVGLGVYALNETGRARFSTFPALSADDLFVQRLFTPDERVVVPSRFVVRVPRTLRALIAVRTRIAAGNAEYEASDHLVPDPVAPSTKQTLLALLAQAKGDPRLLPSIAVYVAVVIQARRRARREGTSSWQRDLSTRLAGGDSPSAA